MKIKTIDGQIVDTDKLSDRESEIAEALENLKELCKRYNMTHICFVALGPENGVSSQTICKIDEVARKELKFLVESMNDYIQRVTNGKWGVQKFEEPEAPNDDSRDPGVK